MFNIYVSIRTSTNWYMSSRWHCWTIDSNST